MASIREVARLANVAPSTVSRALNNSGYVAEETLDKIKKAVEELDYIPNQWIRNLYRQSTGIIGIIVSEISHPFFSELSNCIDKELHKYGYNVMLCSTESDKRREREYLDTLERNLFDGIIGGTSLLEADIYKKLTKPIVVLDRYIEGVPLVCSDHAMGGELAAKTFIERGCRNVVQICGRAGYPMPSYDSHIILEKRLKENGIEVHSIELDWWSLMRFHECAALAEKVLRENPQIDGIFGADLQAAAFSQASLKCGKKIPEELCIVSFDGTYVADVNQASLTIIAQDMKKMAQQTVKILMEIINHKENIPDQTIIPVILK